MAGSKQGLLGKDGCVGKLVWSHYSGNFKNLWLWQPVLDKLNCILELKNWLPFNKTYLWTDLIQILSCTGKYSPPCTPITLLMYTYILDWEFFSDRRFCQLLKPSDVWRLCYQTYQPSDLSKLQSWSCDQQHFCWRRAVMDSVQTKRKPNNSFQNSYHAEGNVKVCMRIYNEWELCRVPSISFHRLHLSMQVCLNLKNRVNKPQENRWV